MRIFISYSHLDREAVDRITSRLARDGHDVWTDSSKLAAGDNFERKIREGLEQTDALIVIVSENSFRSKWVQQEFAAIALQQITKRERRIIPVRIDLSDVPSYLAGRVYIDFSQDFEAGLERLSAELRENTPASMAAAPDRETSTSESRATQIQKLRSALQKGRLTLVCGAGISVQAGVPAWESLLIRLLDAMMERISKDHSLNLGDDAASQFHQRYELSSLILGKYLKNVLGRDFQNEMREALYASNPGTSSLIESIIDLSRPQRDARPLDSIITFNFDCLIEENLSHNRIPNQAIFSESINHEPDQIPIYHVHGFLPRNEESLTDTDLVFSEDAYHSQFMDSFSWSNLIQLNKLTQNVCLFIGISLTDPNMRRLLDVAWRKNPNKTMSHFIVKLRPQLAKGDILDEVSKLLEEQDANGLGLNVIWIDDFGELPGVLREISSAFSNQRNAN